jgi:hypothetical protein
MIILLYLSTPWDNILCNPVMAGHMRERNGCIYQQVTPTLASLKAYHRSVGLACFLTYYLNCKTGRSTFLIREASTIEYLVLYNIQLQMLQTCMNWTYIIYFGRRSQIQNKHHPRKPYESNNDSRDKSTAYRQLVYLVLTKKITMNC